MSYERLFDESFARVNAMTLEGTDFFEAFYQRFLLVSPAVREKFKSTNMARQRRMLKKSFYSLVAFYASGSADSVLERIAESHCAGRLDIPPELYDLWLECLIETAAEFDGGFDDEVELAWRLVLNPGIVYMKFKYAHSGA
ncbi:globin [Mangrovitalea sediminis]|uniref:globin n=1 Tax=Mangrovitalea sediminis TaxID=1982043 RepID=UPI000BE54FC8|nr:globin [Mangrovitalea sediminis]